MKEKRKVNLELLREWTKGKQDPKSLIAVLASVAPETARQTLKGNCPKTNKVRVKISQALGFDEDILFPIEKEDDSAA